MLSDFFKHQKEKKITNLKAEQSYILKQCVMPENFLRFAVKYQNEEWFDLERFTNYIAKTSDYETIIKFAKYIKNADIKKLQNAIYSFPVIHRTYTKLNDISNSKDRYYDVPKWLTYGRKFVTEIPNADTKMAIMQLENAINKVSQNKFDDLHPSNKKPLGPKVYHKYLYEKWLSELLKYLNIKGYNVHNIENYLITSKTCPKYMITEIGCNIKQADVPRIYKFLIHNNEKELAKQLYEIRQDYRRELIGINKTKTM